MERKHNKVTRSKNARKSKRNVPRKHTRKNNRQNKQQLRGPFWVDVYRAKPDVFETLYKASTPTEARRIANEMRDKGLMATVFSRVKSGKRNSRRVRIVKGI